MRRTNAERKIRNGKRKISIGERKIRNGGANSKRNSRAGIKKERQYNLRMKELEMQDKAKTKPLGLGTHFDVTQHIRLVPPFQEKEVDKYFPTLKKLLKI